MSKPRAPHVPRAHAVTATLGRRWSADNARGVSTQSLLHMLRLAEAFAALENVSTLSRQWAWSPLVERIDLFDAILHAPAPGKAPT